MEMIKVFEVRTFHNSHEFVFEGPADGESNSGLLRVRAPHPDSWRKYSHASDCVCGARWESEDGRPVEPIFR